VHRLSHLVALDECADPLVPGVRGGGPGLEGKAVRSRRCLPSLLAAQHEDGAKARNGGGGVFVDGIHFRYGGQVRSLLSLVSYLGSGEYRRRYLGVRIPPTNIQEYHLEAARTFANALADRLFVAHGSNNFKAELAS
jgi:hypothetical protein